MFISYKNMKLNLVYMNLQKKLIKDLTGGLGEFSCMLCLCAMFSFDFI